MATTRCSLRTVDTSTWEPEAPQTGFLTTKETRLLPRTADAMTSKLDLANWKSLPEETLLTVEDAAIILNMSKRNVSKAAKNGVLPSYRPRTEAGSLGDYRIMLEDLVDYLEGSRVTVKSARRAKTARRAKGKPLKHIVPTWSPEQAPQQDEHCHELDGRNGRSSARSCGRGGHR